jgi:dynein light intermediate chain
VLQEQLDQQLQQRHARETGICPIREELYSQCFGTLLRASACYTPYTSCAPCTPYMMLIFNATDELIRQITINCAERGLLLLRVRDQIRMTMTAYQTLYESSIAFGIRKSLMAEQTKAELEAKVASPLRCCSVSLLRRVRTCTAEAPYKRNRRAFGTGWRLGKNHRGSRSQGRREARSG